MKIARIAGPFLVSIVLFILAYLSSRDEGSGLFPIMLFFVGLIMAFAGVAAVFTSGQKT